MTKLTFTIIAILAVLSTAQNAASREDRFKKKWLSNPLVQRRSRVEIERLRNLRRDVFENGCVVNLCFLLEGSNAVTEEEYTDMKNFVDLIVAITTTDDPGNYCAAQFGNSFTRISRLTQQREVFLDAVQASKKSGGRANLVAGLRFGLKQLARQDVNANKIIFFSKQQPRNIRRLPFGLNQFFKRGGAVCAVAMENKHYDVLAKYTGDINRVVPLDGFFDLSEIVVAIVADVCSMPCGTRPESKRRFGPGTPRECPRRLGERPTKPERPVKSPRPSKRPSKKF